MNARSSEKLAMTHKNTAFLVMKCRENRNIALALRKFHAVLSATWFTDGMG
jgi:hypothetical protein